MEIPLKPLINQNMCYNIYSFLWPAGESPYQNPPFADNSRRLNALILLFISERGLFWNDRSIGGNRLLGVPQPSQPFLRILNLGEPRIGVLPEGEEFLVMQHNSFFHQAFLLLIIRATKA